jgi:asparagine synthase (glutamine-hydrolysing)
MAGIAGIDRPDKIELVNRMLDKMTHRGWAWREVALETKKTYGALGIKIQEQAMADLKLAGLARDGTGEGHFAQAQAKSTGFELKRDLLGVAPLYYGKDADGILCFASEVKGLLEATRDVHELPPGHTFDGQKLESYHELTQRLAEKDTIEKVAQELRRRLEISVERCIGDGNVGVWLSGGLNSSVLAALVRPRVRQLHTFSIGFPGAPDLEAARLMADFLHSDHHEVVIRFKDLLDILPEAIYYLESFDALVVRSSMVNYLVARTASGFVPAVFSGEGGDELFAGYEYLKSLTPARLPNELIDITGNLHNTALQRVDRCAAAHGTVVHVGFLDPEVVEYALRIPVAHKIHAGIGKWILRQAVVDLLPEAITNRPAAKFWEGAGVGRLMAEFAGGQINDKDFRLERYASNGWKLTSKEELAYYRIFRKHFGEFKDLSWIGRTKVSPKICPASIK